MQSAFSAARATVLKLFTGRPYFGAGVSFAPGTSAIEPGVTPQDGHTVLADV